MKWSESCSLVSNSFWPRGLYSAWKSPCQNTKVGSLSLLQGIFSTQGVNPGLPHCRRILLLAEPQLFNKWIVPLQMGVPIAHCPQLSAAPQILAPDSGDCEQSLHLWPGTSSIPSSVMWPRRPLLGQWGTCCTFPSGPGGWASDPCHPWLLLRALPVGQLPYIQNALYPASSRYTVTCFKKTQYTPQWLRQFIFPPTVQEDSLFSIPSPAFTVCRFFADGHSDWHEVTSHCSFDLHFSNNQWCWTSFHMPHWPSVCFLWEMSI